MAKDDVFLALADFLIPAYQDKPKFSDVCTYEDARAALGFRHDLAEAFERALNLDVGGGAEAALEELNAKDNEGFSALTTIVITTYYIESEGAAVDRLSRPGERLLQFQGDAGLSRRRFARQGDRARPQIPPNSRTLIPARRRKRKSCPVSRSSIRASRR